jgi:hypothetical protein
MNVLLVKTFGWASVLRNSLWMGLLMVFMTLVDSTDVHSVLYRVAIKSMEFYIMWSSYAAFKLFKSFKKVKRPESPLAQMANKTFSLCSCLQRNPANLSYFINDCALSGAADLTFAFVFAVRFLQHGRGLLLAAVFASSTALNILFFISARVVQNRMKCEKTAEKRLNEIMRHDELDMYETTSSRIPSANRTSESHNYCYEIVFQEINSIYESAV